MRKKNKTGDHKGLSSSLDHDKMNKPRSNSQSKIKTGGSAKRTMDASSDAYKHGLEAQEGLGRKIITPSGSAVNLHAIASDEKLRQTVAVGGKIDPSNYIEVPKSKNLKRKGSTGHVDIAHKDSFTHS